MGLNNIIWASIQYNSWAFFTLSTKVLTLVSSPSPSSSSSSSTGAAVSEASRRLSSHLKLVIYLDSVFFFVFRIHYRCVCFDFESEKSVNLLRSSLMAETCSSLMNLLYCISFDMACNSSGCESGGCYGREKDNGRKAVDVTLCVKCKCNEPMTFGDGGSDDGRFCAECFRSNVYGKFRLAVTSHAMITPSDNVLVAFSGGSSSRFCSLPFSRAAGPAL